MPPFFSKSTHNNKRRMLDSDMQINENVNMRSEEFRNQRVHLDEYDMGAEENTGFDIYQPQQFQNPKTPQNYYNPSLDGVSMNT